MRLRRGVSQSSGTRTVEMTLADSLFVTILRPTRPPVHFPDAEG
jgi:hypothetical protein